MAILISDKINFKIKIVKRGKEGHYIMVKGSIHQEDETIVDMHEPNIWAPLYMKETLRKLKGEMNSNTTIIGDFSTLISVMDRKTRKKINKETGLHITIGQVHLADVYRTFHLTAA